MRACSPHRASPVGWGRNVRSRGVREAILLSGSRLRVQSEEIRTGHHLLLLSIPVALNYIML
jgi:hypothetical protein